MNAHVRFLGIVCFVIGVLGCAQRIDDASAALSAECSSDDGTCHGYTYVTGGPDGRRLGQFGNFGGVGNYGHGAAWSATLTRTYQPGGCLVYGPYESFPASQGYLTAYIDVEGEACRGNTGNCGADYWLGYTGSEYEKSHHTASNSFVVDLTMNGGTKILSRQVLDSNKSIPFQRLKLESGHLTSALEGVEVRICDLRTGRHMHVYDCHYFHDEERCKSEEITNTFRVSVSQIDLIAFYENPNN